MVPNVISDDADCPGRGRMAGEGAIGRVREDEVSGGAACPMALAIGPRRLPMPGRNSVESANETRSTVVIG